MPKVTLGTGVDARVTAASWRLRAGAASPEARRPASARRSRWREAVVASSQSRRGRAGKSEPHRALCAPLSVWAPRFSVCMGTVAVAAGTS